MIDENGINEDDREIIDIALDALNREDKAYKLKTLSAVSSDRRRSYYLKNQAKEKQRSREYYQKYKKEILLRQKKRIIKLKTDKLKEGLGGN